MNEETMQPSWKSVLEKTVVKLNRDLALLRAECAAWRRVEDGPKPRGPFCSTECLGGCEGCKNAHAASAARKAVDDAGAMGEAKSG